MAKTARELRVLYVEFGPAQRPDALRFLEQTLGRIFPGSALAGRVIDTSGTSPAEPLGPLQFVRSPNDHREFSGWQTGWDSLGEAPPEAAVCICNDTFFRNYGAEYLDWFDSQEVEAALRRGQWIGYMDRFLRPVEIFGTEILRYLRTSFLLARARDVQQVMPLTLPVAEDRIFAPSGPSLFRGDAPLSANLRNIIDCWLCRADPLPDEFADHWHHSEPLTEESRARLQAKAKSILMEHWLAAKIQRSGKPLSNVRTYRAHSLAWWGLDRCGLLEPIQTYKQRRVIASRIAQIEQEKLAAKASA